MGSPQKGRQRATLSLWKSDGTIVMMIAVRKAAVMKGPGYSANILNNNLNKGGLQEYEHG